MAGLLSGRIDFVVGALRAAPGDAFVSQALLSDEAALIARAGHPLAERKQLAFSDLADYPWVLSRAGTPLRESLVHFHEGLGVVAPVPAVETGDLALLRGLLLASDMLTVLSAHQLHHEIRTGQLVVLPFDMPGLARDIGVTTRRGAHLAPGARALLGEIERVGARFS
jgi:LysR family transcriptional regulator of gallate degradation